jgi:hypothetical protein
MVKLIDSAVAHFSSKELREVEISEWGATLFAKNLTLDDKAKMLRRSDSDNTDYLILTLIFGLVDDTGDQVFNIGDKLALRNQVDPEVVQRVATFILTSNTEEEREKNS